MTFSNTIAIIAGLFLAIAAPAWSQSAGNVFGAQSVTECPKETRPQAVDPFKVECFAEFSDTRVPRAPENYVPDDPVQVVALEEYGIKLMQELNKPGICHEGTKRARDEACALIVYTIDQEFRQTGVPLSEAAYVGPWTFIIVVYRIANPEDLRAASLWTVNSNYSEGWYGPGRKNELWRLTALQRMFERCKERGGTRARASIVSAGVVTGSCTNESAEPTFAPQLIVPCGKPHGIFARHEDMERFCRAPTYLIENVELAMLNN